MQGSLLTLMGNRPGPFGLDPWVNLGTSLKISNCRATTLLTKQHITTTAKFASHGLRTCSALKNTILIVITSF